MPRLRAGDKIQGDGFDVVGSARLPLPHPQWLTHLQFRRFAGCPICNLHLREFLRRHKELEAAGVQAVAVFHSPADDLAETAAATPLTLVADPGKRLYRRFGVESSLRSVLDPRAWPAAIGGLLRVGPGFPGRGESPLGLPADFLIDTQGVIRALHYGQHADDQWSVDEVLRQSALIRVARAA